MKYLILLLALLPFIYAQDPCNQYNTSCTACTNQLNCGWCTAVQTCMSGSLTGPAGSGVCLGQAWQFGQGQCAKCESFKDCRQCMANAADCGWCNQAGKQQCAPWSFFQGVGACKASVQCPCNVYKSCDQCTIGPNCQWCLSSETCADIDLPCNNSSPGFNKTTGCACATNKDCFACKNAYNCQWCQNSGLCQERGQNGNCTVSLGDSCDAYCKLAGSSSCSVCNNLNGCGWCGGTAKTCTDVNYATCIIAHTCDAECSTHKYCDPCNDNPNCVWCDSDRKCKKTSDPCTLSSHSCPKFCNALSTCASCNAQSGCGWCPTGDNGICLDVNDQECSGIWAHSCDPVPIKPPQKCGFDGGAFVGGMFLVIGVIVLGAVAYVVYRWKTGRKILYTELR